MSKCRMSNDYTSWGRFPLVSQDSQFLKGARLQLPDRGSVLPYGLGRSYGDSCLNADNTLLHSQYLDHFIKFDPQTGTLEVESGVSFAELLKFFVPRGWFPPVSPGTKYVSIGGALANDVHGKNHHKAGSFGCHVEAFELLRSDGSKLNCSNDENEELFSATIGGLGLTGFVSKLRMKMSPIYNELIDVDSIRFNNLEEFFSLSKESEEFPYSVSWIDCLQQGKGLGRGIFMRGRHNTIGSMSSNQNEGIKIPFLFDAPSFMLNKYSIKLFNEIYFRKQRRNRVSQTVHFNSFFYPLDSVQNWNRMYGKRGFLQWQCVVPYDDGHSAIHEILTKIAKSGKASFLAVLKTFGDIHSPGMMSFPRKGVTLALDFPNDGGDTFRLLDSLDLIVRRVNGAIYPAKDARMSKETFMTSFPRFLEFKEFVDPAFSSSFWRRVK